MAARRATKGHPHFRSSRELRKILDQVLTEIESNPDEAPRLRSAAAPARLEFPDLHLVLTLTPGGKGGRPFDWKFSKRGRGTAKLRLTMDSEIANRFFQGKENPAIALARGRIRTTCADPAAALRFFPAAKPLITHYSRLVASDYPHLALD